MLWKIAEVKMIHKPNKPFEDRTFYWSVSWLTITFKLFEKLLLQRLGPIIYGKKLIWSYQFGFRNRHSSITWREKVLCNIIPWCDPSIQLWVAPGPDIKVGKIFAMINELNSSFIYRHCQTLIENTNKKTLSNWDSNSGKCIGYSGVVQSCKYTTRCFYISKFCSLCGFMVSNFGDRPRNPIIQMFQNKVLCSIVAVP